MNIYGVLVSISPRSSHKPNLLRQACILLGCVFMFLIYRSVRETEVRIARYAGGIATAAPNQHASSNAYDSSTDVTEPSRKARVASHKRSQAVAIQSMWYLGAFLLTYTMHLAVYICWKFKQQWWEPLDFFAYLLLPLQGFFNFVIFSRKREDMSTPEGHLLRRLICCLYCRRWVGRYQVRRRSLNSKASGQSTAANGETLVSMGANESEAVMERTSEEQEEHKQEPPKNRSTSVDAV